jgi:hypothetical protein
MRMFYRSAPVFVALSVALAGCSESNPGAKNSAGSSANTQASSASSATADPSASTQVCLTVEGMT